MHCEPEAHARSLTYLAASAPGFLIPPRFFSDRDTVLLARLVVELVVGFEPQLEHRLHLRDGRHVIACEGQHVLTLIDCVNERGRAQGINTPVN